MLAVLLTGISKSGFGGGLGVLAVPLMALYVSPFQAAAIMLPILCAMDVINVWVYRKTWDRTNIKILLPASLVGVVIGALTFRYLSDAHIRILVGAIAVAFSILFFLRRNDAYIEQVNAAGGDALMMYLPDLGIRGNSHMLMQDRNSNELAELVLDWIDTHVEGD